MTDWFFGKDALPEYANSVQRIAEVRIENDGGKAVKILEAIGSYWTFDGEGKIDKGLRNAGVKAIEIPD